MKIIAFGDIHGRLAMLDRLKGEIASADAVVVTGDLTQFGGVAEARPVIEALKAVNPRLLAQAGNLDLPEVEPWLAGLGLSLHGRGHRIGEMGFFGCGGGNPSPFNTPNELGEEEIAVLLARGYGEIADAPFRIMVSHPPPFGTKVDVVRSGLHVGSRAVRAFIEAHQPHLCLCGHIHEAAGEDFVGKTHIINPGPFGEGGYMVVHCDESGLRAELRLLA